jgi:transcriptional regulator with XRE-family HTH domain
LNENKLQKSGLVNFGKAMKVLRKEKGMTQGDIYRATKLERSYISRLECGKIIYPRIETVAKIASAFGISVIEFLKYAIDHNED